MEGLGKVDILVCNAGIHTSGTAMSTKRTWKEFREVIENHIMGAFNVRPGGVAAHEGTAPRETYN